LCKFITTHVYVCARTRTCMKFHAVCKVYACIHTYTHASAPHPHMYTRHTKVILCQGVTWIKQTQTQASCASTHTLTHTHNVHRWYSLKDKRNTDAGSVRIRTAVEGDISMNATQGNNTPLSTRSSEKERSNLSSNSSNNNEPTVRTPAGPLRNETLQKDALMSPVGSPSVPSTTTGWGSPSVPSPTTGWGRGAIFGKGRTPRGARVPPPQNPTSPLQSDGIGDPSAHDNGAQRPPQTGLQKTFQYKLGDMVGRGAFGKVFQAMNLENGELIAVK
jgi:hypothetical protein